MTVPLAKQINCIEFVIHNGDPSWRRLPDLRAVLATLQQHERAMAALRAIYEAPDDLPGWVIAVCREALEGDTK